MRTAWLAAGALAASVLVVGCAREAKIDEARLGQLPMEDKQAIFTAQHNVTVAEANKVSAERARDQAESYRDIADNEVNAAEEREKAAKEALELAQRTKNTESLRNAERAGDLASKEIIASKSKEDYSKRLVDLRQSEVDLADRRLEAARADLSYVQADSLRRHGIDPGVNMSDVLSQRDEKSRRVVEQERTVANMRDEVNALRVAWEQRRRAFNLAQRETPGIPPVRPPGGAREIEPEAMPPEGMPPMERTPPPSEEEVNPQPRELPPSM